MKRCLPLLCSVLALVACSTAGKKPPGSPAAAAPASKTVLNLTAEQADIRAKQVGRVSYTLWFGLDQESDSFEGRTVIRFELKPRAPEASKDLYLDFDDGTVKLLAINGNAITDSRYDGHRIHLHVSELHSGQNKLEVVYGHKYATNGDGLQRFKDPVDEQVYLYSNFEPYSANRMFPCFDQPDLKASYELTVEAPEEWQVISNTPERDVTHVNGRDSWQFPPSPLLSTYLVALHAGPFAVWKADADGIPLRLFARKSLAKYVDYNEWFDITRDGLDHYSVLFGYPYPYAKYDQILCPDYNVGAMENAGAVTFTERYIYRSKVTQDQRRRRANTILHEMSHMWFGDLVTMKWWNGLWLNESFATFMAAGAVDEATKFKGSWQQFNSEKSWAYHDDQLVTTHPIEVPIPDTDSAFSNFDGITYEKGASSLQQLHYYLGDEDFREGIQRYFQRYALHNTTISDFMGMLAEASGKDLDSWRRLWLETAGLNTVRAEILCANEKISKFNLLQSAPADHPDLRPHKMRVALFDSNLRLRDTFETAYSSAVTPVKEAVGKKCSDLVVLNYEDQDYVKVELDPATLQTVSEKIGGIQDTMVRQMLWHTLWEMVIDAKIAPQKFIQTALNQLGTEKDTGILTGVLRVIDRPFLNRDSAMKYLGGPLRADYLGRWETFTLANLEKAPAGTDLQLIWYQAFLDAAHTPDGLDFVRGLYLGKRKLSGLKIDQDRRWELVSTLARGHDGSAGTYIDAELKKDATDTGDKAAVAAEVQIPDPAVKAKWMNEVLHYSEGKMKWSKLSEAMSNFNTLNHEDLAESGAPAYFDRLPEMVAHGDEEYGSHLASDFFPGVCSAANVDRTTALLNSHPELPAYVSKELKINRQQEERCVRARAKSSSE